MAKLSASGDQVTILNLCSGTAPPPYSPFATRFHNVWGNPDEVVCLRRDEDRAAAVVLDVSVHFEEGIPDAIYRRSRDGSWMYNEDSELFGPRHPDDNWLIAHLAGRVRAYPGSDVSRIYAPLGVGNHVDHVNAFQVGQSLAQSGYDVLFYEDFPYVKDSERYEQRIASLPGWNSSVVEFGEEHLRSKIKALGSYESQIPMIFGDQSKMSSSLAEYGREVSQSDFGYGERYWQGP